MIFRTGGAGLLIPGIKVVQAGAGETPWYLAAGVTPVAAYAPKGAADLAASYINLANPSTNDAAPGVAPTFDTSTGWTFNGTTQYSTTGITPAAGWSALVRFSNLDASGVDCLLGEYNAAPNSWMTLTAEFGNMGLYYGNSSPIYSPSRLVSGNIAVGGTKAYIDGAALAGTFSAFSGTAVALAIGAANNNGTIAAFASTKIQAIAIYSSILDATQIATTTTAMAAL